MKAICYQQYGSYNNLHVQELDKPTPQRGEVLVKVMASSINSWDVDMLKGNTWIIRALSGIFKPRYTILGADIAGIVQAAGENATVYQPGDEVYGDIAEAGFGGFAEYVAVPEKLLARKPAILSFEEAAALPQAGLLAVQGLRYRDDIKPGQHLLINGAGGGVGTLALQYAKSMGAIVTCVDRKEKLEFLRTLGADQVIDFNTTDYTNTGVQYDKILDVIAHRSASDYLRALKPGGVFAMIGGSMGGLLFRMMVVEPFRSRYRSRKLGIMGYKTGTKELDELTRLVIAGRMNPIIDSVYPLVRTTEAFRHFMSGMFKGKIVITNSGDPQSKVAG
jgi:NADPH:quinone reductase-like Zn-dependent oxidoreductase